MRSRDIGAMLPIPGAACTFAVAVLAVTAVGAAEPVRASEPWRGYAYTPATAERGAPQAPPANLGRARGASSGQSAFAPSYDWWSGFYLGGTVGYGMGSTRVRGDAGRFSHDQNGPMAGVLGGYNWMRENFVGGLEGEVKASWLSGSANVGGRDLDQSMPWMGTVRARVGMMMSPALLVYGLAGVSAADIRLKGAVLGNGRADDIFLGLQVGGGAEMKLAEQWSVRADYTYTNFGKEQIGPAGAANTFDPSVHALQTSIIFRF